MKLMAMSLIAWLLLSGCGGSPTVTIRIQTDSTPPNALDAVAAGFGTTSRGIYFEFYELATCPVSIEDVISSSPALQTPSLSTSQAGWNPDIGEGRSVTIDTSRLNPNKLYKVALKAVGISPSTVTHQGTSDCPLSLRDPNMNQIDVCFHSIAVSQPICLNSTPFSQCCIPACGQCPPGCPSSCLSGRL